MRMKSYHNRGKTEASANIFDPLGPPSKSMQNMQNIYQMYKHTSTASAQANFSANFCQGQNELLDGLLEKTASEDPEFEMYLPVMKKLSQLKYKNIIKESLDEINRKTKNFACIYPAPGCEIYDKLFIAIRPLNKLLARILYHDDLEFSETANMYVPSNNVKKR
jgi:hypothetical protein